MFGVDKLPVIALSELDLWVSMFYGSRIGGIAHARLRGGFVNRLICNTSPYFASEIWTFIISLFGRFNL